MPTHERQNHLYVLTDRDHFDSYGRYTPALGDFHDIVRALLPDTWQLRRTDFWFVCTPPEGIRVSQGWKIHVSATLPGGRDLLEAVVPLLAETGTPFKFALDKGTLAMMNGKTWNRGGSGKFVTIYPPTTERFLDLLPALHERTAAMQGPMILSDRRYPGSSVVQYRYGGFVGRPGVGIQGEKNMSILAPDGTPVDDVRTPYFNPPAWAKDPLPAEEPAEAAPAETYPANTLNRGRYVIDNAITFRSAGGVYDGHEAATMRPVIIKEARPHVLFGGGHDAVTLLQKEHAVMQAIARHGIGPEPIDLFQDWEHWFLVEEKIEGVSLAQFMARTSPLLLPRRPEAAEMNTYVEEFRTIFLAMVDYLEKVQQAGIVLTDLSPANVMIKPETYEMRLIDFEAACRLGIDPPVQVGTPGYTDPKRTRSQPAHTDDLYSLGALMLGHIFRINTLMAIDPVAGARFLAEIAREYALPATMRDLPLALMDNDVAKRPTLEEVRRRLLQMPAWAEPASWRAPVPREVLPPGQMAQAAMDYIESVAEYDRSDRLFPADPRQFQTNALSLAYGACGVACAFKRVRGSVPERVLEWIDRQPIDPRQYPPGLYVGVSGIAWALDELGMREKAERLLAQSCDDPRIEQRSDLYFGLAGWGLTQLRFYLATGKVAYLDRAKDAASRLIASKVDDEEGNGVYWADEKRVQLGLAHGASGIALFLLYLYLVTRDEQILEVGRSAVYHDLSKGMDKEGLTFLRYRNSGGAFFPYWRYGGAGIGAVVLRYHAALADRPWKTELESIAKRTVCKYSVFSGLLNGLAGLGQVLLDVYAWSGDDRHLADAKRVYEGLSLFEVKRPGGIAFPGEGLLRISCDYATGGAGVAVFLDRLAHPEKEMPFFLDGLIPAMTAARNVAAVA